MTSVEILKGTELAQQLGAIVARLPIGVLIFDTESRCVVFANSAARALVYPERIRLRRAIPDPWESFSLPQFAARLVERGVGAEGRAEVDGGHTYAVSGLGARGSTNAILLIEDVSAEARRSRAAREFAANAAHELLTPLTGIVSAAHVLESGAKELPQERDRFIAHISHECSRLTRIARSLLILARAQSGEEPPRLDAYPLRELLDDVTASFSADVEMRCDDATTVFTDADLFVQALVNLVENAIKHGDGGEVVVECREVGSNVAQIDIVEPGTTAHRSASAYRGRFRTADGRDGGGYGLGLSIAEQSLEAVGGRFELRDGVTRIEVPRGGVLSRERPRADR
jgi:two-component system, OmpR family, phosphate regulon sensor histidine kinase PhoR